MISAYPSFRRPSCSRRRSAFASQTTRCCDLPEGTSPSALEPGHISDTQAPDPIRLHRIPPHENYRNPVLRHVHPGHRTPGSTSDRAVVRGAHAAHHCGRPTSGRAVHPAVVRVRTQPTDCWARGAAREVRGARGRGGRGAEGGGAALADGCRPGATADIGSHRWLFRRPVDP